MVFFGMKFRGKQKQQIATIIAINITYYDSISVGILHEVGGGVWGGQVTLGGFPGDIPPSTSPHVDAHHACKTIEMVKRQFKTCLWHQT